MTRFVVTFLFMSLIASSLHAQLDQEEERSIGPLNECDRYSLFGITTGMWSPRGQNSLLGDHPFVGLMGAEWRQHFYYEVLMEFRFIKSDNPYYVQYAGYPELTDHYFGSFVGAELGYEIVRDRNTSIYGLAGGGLDSFNMIEADPSHEEPTTACVFSKNLGFGIQRYFGQGSYVGLEVTYNFTGYENPGGTPIGGNALNIRLLIGAIGYVANP